MVLKSHLLARASLLKSFTHGYAQSVVAASQTSYASQHNFGTLGNSFASRLNKNHSQNVLQSHNAQNDRGLKAGHADRTTDSGLAAYYAAWQKQQRSDAKEWQQYQFTKRIEWSPAVAPHETKAKEDAVVEETAEPVPTRASAPRSYSTSAVDDLRQVSPEDAVEAEALKQVDEAIAEEIAKAKEQTISASTALQEVIGSPEVSSQTAESNTDSASQRLSTPATSVSSEADQYIEHLQYLASTQQYDQIPVIFKALVERKLEPTAEAYNALLLSAIRLTKGKHQVVPKALDVYSDMLRRRVAPDAQTYTTLMELLSVRTLNVLSMKHVLEEKRTRFGGMDQAGKFMFHSNETEYAILAEDDSASIAVKIFDSATASHLKRPFAEKTYRVLITACAESGRVEDMVRIFSHMESQHVLPSADIFVPMIQAFAKSGDLRSAVECYDEYKSLAISHDDGKISLSRKDNDVYAALIKAYAICGRPEGAFKFLEKIEDNFQSADQVYRFRDIVGLKAFVPEWLKQANLGDALHYAKHNLSEQAKPIAFAAIAIRAADLNQHDVATDAFNALPASMDLSAPAMAMGAMHIRHGDVEASGRFWKILETSTTKPQFIESAAMHTIGLIGSGSPLQGLRQMRQMFARIRDSQQASNQAKMDIVEQVDEAVEVVGHFMVKRGIVLPAQPSMELMWTMIENGGLVAPVAGHLLAGLGPDGIAQLGWQDINLLMQVQAGMVINSHSMDIANTARFAHLLDVIVTSGVTAEKSTISLVEEALSKLERPDLQHKWYAYRYPSSEPMYTPMQHAAFVAPPTPAPVPTQVSFEDSYDPYAATTDNKGSVAITDLLEKSHGRSSSHLNEALMKFKNMRRAGRHPRFFTYAKLIAAAAKENRMNLAHEILNLAKQDVPLQSQYRIVRYGWVTILDAMVAACLTTGQRNMAAQYHQDLLELGAAPSANTFGLYITTLKESTKTFDEASEAVRIFLRAKAEGVEPTSFLYNALIGKLGKARRIDDCLFYFGEMRNLGIRPTSVTYGTIVNALCRVSDEKFAEELFEEMESMPNYKPRPAPYHSLMQFFLTTKRDRSKVLAYYERMRSKNIVPTTHTFKLLIDTYATLEPVNMEAAEAVLGQIRSSGAQPDAVHFSSLIHAKGCVQHDMAGARALFDEVMANKHIPAQACLYQALFEAMVANHQIADTEAIVMDMRRRGVAMTPYIANSLIHGWALANDISKAKAIYDAVPVEKREPSTYEAMTRAYMAVEDKANAVQIVNEGLSRGYPSAVAGKILELVGGGRHPTLAETTA